MSINLLKEITENKFLLIMLEESQYISKLEEIIKSIKKTNICYVCLSTPYTDVIEELKKKGIATTNFFFIDTLTSHYREPKPVDNCIFVKAPTDMAAIRIAIRKVVEEKKCNVILFDTISTFLIYQETSSIVKFTHSLLTDEKHKNIKKLFVIIKDSSRLEENQKLVSDLTMFADKTIDLV